MPVQSTEMSIPGKNQHVNCFGRLGIGEPEHLLSLLFITLIEELRGVKDPYFLLH